MPNYGSSNLKVSDAITVAQVGGVTDAYPTHFAFLGKGGWRSAPSLSLLNATSAQRLEEGCAGYVWNDSGNNGLYVWNGSTWVKTSLSPTAYSLPISSASVLGGVRIPSGGPISINSGNGDLSLRIASTSATGIVRVGSGLAIDDSTGILSVTAANLTVKNDTGSYSESYPTLRFKGTGITGISKSIPNNENIVTIDAPTATVGGTAGEFTNIVFTGTGAVSVTGNYDPGTKTYTVTHNATSGGALKQNLSELDDVTITSPLDTQILQYNGSNWVNSPYTPGIALTDISANTPVAYTINSGKAVISMPVANGTTNGYLSFSDWNTFNNKQAALISSANIKTINGASLLGSGDIVISGGGGGTVTSVAFTTNTDGTNVSSATTTTGGAVEITLSIPTASSSNRGVITSGQFDTFNTVTDKLNITAGTSSPLGTTLTLDFSVADTIYGTFASPRTQAFIDVSTTSAKVGVTHIVVHRAGGVPTINNASKLSGSGNYKINTINYIYFTFISGSTVIYSINQAS